MPEYKNNDNYVNGAAYAVVTQRDGMVVHAIALRLFFSKPTYCNCEGIASTDLCDKSYYTSTIFQHLLISSLIHYNVVKL